MLLRRCAWCGRPLGIKWCKQWGITHGICKKCFKWGIVDRDKWQGVNWHYGYKRDVRPQATRNDLCSNQQESGCITTTCSAVAKSPIEHS